MKIINKKTRIKAYQNAIDTINDNPDLMQDYGLCCWLLKAINRFPQISFYRCGEYFPEFHLFYPDTYFDFDNEERILVAQLCIEIAKSGDKYLLKQIIAPA